jgi:hypothetical protein
MHDEIFWDLGAVAPVRHFSGSVQRVFDALLVCLLVAAAFLLRCQKLYDADVWWHLRSGQWISEHGHVPSLDPFTFGSADRSWIDLHWLFQLILAGAFWAGGVRGVIVMAALISATVLLLCATTRRSGWPMWVIAACWLPALLAMSARFQPRPELVTVVAMAAYLTVLFRADRRPELTWVLVPIQVVWVNAHGLFVLGLLILATYMLGHLLDSRGDPVDSWAVSSEDSGTARSTRAGARAWWCHVGGALVAASLAGLLNPHALRGALFPLELFPKITAWGGPYKATILESMDLRTFVRRAGAGSAAANLYFRAECFLLWVVPISFIVPAVWRLDRTARDCAITSSLGGSAPSTRARVWWPGLGRKGGVTRQSSCGRDSQENAQVEARLQDETFRIRQTCAPAPRDRRDFASSALDGRLTLIGEICGLRRDR